MKASSMRVFLIILDGVGIGELPDAAKYGDEGSNTLVNLAEAVGGLFLPNLERLGLGNIAPIKGLNSVPSPLGCYGVMHEASPGKDSTSGHWEIAGVILKQPFPTYPNGFPPEVIREFEKRIGRKVLGNKPASGTEIIKELGDEHIQTGKPIVYTSADSVFQIAAHEEVIPPEELYRMCEIAREILKGEHSVGRVIARPFVGTSGSFTRTPRRKDFSLPPPEPTLVDILSDAGYDVVSIGKVSNLFANRGFTERIPSASNSETMERILEIARRGGTGLIFATLVDFDMLWGHRNDPAGFKQGLEEFDSQLGVLIETIKPEDVVFITADHGCDPTTPSTDHSREQVPLLGFGSTVRKGVDVGIRKTFADLGATIGEIFGVKTQYGTSFLEEIKVG